MNPIRHTADRLDVERLFAGTSDRWVPVEKMLPDDSETVLVFVDGEPWTGYTEAGSWHYVCGDPLGGRVTHWMHFPDGPQMEDAA